MWAVIGLVAWGIIGAPLLYSERERQHEPQRGQYSKNEQSHPDKGSHTASGVQIECDPNCTAKHADGDRNNGAVARLLYKTVDDPLALFTAILDLATLGLVLFMGIQIKDARRSSERQLRAYVNVEKAEILNFGQGTVRLRVVVKNSGQTPAYKMQQWTAVVADDLPPTVEFTPPGQGRKPTHHSTLPPGAVYTVLQDYGPLTASHVKKIEDGKAAIWTWGDITYFDAFDRPRQSRFRLVFRMDGTPTKPPGGMATDEDGNEST